MPEEYEPSEESAARILRRDQFVLDQLIERKLPTLVVPSGGYSPESYRMLADIGGYVIDRWSPGSVV